MILILNLLSYGKEPSKKSHSINREHELERLMPIYLNKITKIGIPQNLKLNNNKKRTSHSHPGKSLRLINENVPYSRYNVI